MNRALVDWLMAPMSPTSRSRSRTSCTGLSGTSGPLVGAVGTRSFFSVAPENLERARAVCAGCSVREECYAYAMDDPGPSGFVGWVHGEGTAGAAAGAGGVKIPR
jgi:hypothetical protein